MTKYNVNVSCWGKVPYETWSKASKVIRRQFREVKGTGRKDEAGVYRCRICHKWHVGGGRERD